MMNMQINFLLIFLFSAIDLSLSGELVENRTSLLGNLGNRKYYENFVSSFLEGVEDEVETSKAIVRAALPPHISYWFKSGVIDNFLDTQQIPAVNQICQADVNYWMNEVKLLNDGDKTIFEVETWVLHMLDSWGKFPAGILSGHINSLGDWDECVELKGKRDTSEFGGRYCTSYIVPNDPNPAAVKQELCKGNYSFLEGRMAVPVPELIDQICHPDVFFLTAPTTATCWPSSCSQQEITIILGGLLATKPFALVPQYCSTIDRPELTAGNIAMISVLSVLGALCVSATLVDVIVAKEKRRGVGIQVLLAFSLYTNAIKIVSTKSEAGQFGSLHGIRFFSTCWVVFGHSNLFYLFQPFLWNTTDLDRMYNHHWTHWALLQGFFSVDTFFAMSGMLACFGLMRALKKSKGKINVPMLYLHRYLRITPTYALLIGLIAAIFPLIGRGPWWAYRVEKTAKDCQDGWWKNLLYIQNLYSYNRRIGEEMCQGESWYIANDFQFFLLMPIFVYLIWRWRYPGLGFLAVCSLASMIAPGVATWEYGLPPVKLTWQSSSTMVYDIYDKPWYRIGPYLAGLVGGFILYKTSGKPIKLPKWAVALGWSCSTAAALGIIFGIRPYYNPNVDWSLTGSAIYAGISRYLWGAIIMWIIFACQFGYGGWINDFLSWKVFMPLGRLTFCVYMSSTSIQELFHYQLRYNDRYAVYSLIQTFFGHLVTCFLVGFFLTITMESPFIQLEKIAFGGATRAPRKTPVEEGKPAEETKANV